MAKWQFKYLKNAVKYFKIHSRGKTMGSSGENGEFKNYILDIPKQAKSDLITPNTL